LATIDDEKIFSLMREELKDFSACVRSGGGASCIEGSSQIGGSLN